MRFRFLTQGKGTACFMKSNFYHLSRLPFRGETNFGILPKRLKPFCFGSAPARDRMLDWQADVDHDAYTSYTVTHPRGYPTVWQLINAAVVESSCGSLSPSQLVEDSDTALVSFSIAIHRQLPASILHSTPPRCSQIALDMNSKSILIY